MQPSTISTDATNGPARPRRRDQAGRRRRAVKVRSSRSSHYYRAPAAAACGEQRMSRDRGHLLDTIGGRKGPFFGRWARRV